MTRLLDITLACLALILFAPIMVLIILVLRFSGEGEIFFVQDRVGKQGNMFKLLKFATMLKNSPNMGTGTVTLQNDPRILPVGQFLRRSKLNELPQLWNILVGDMSVVGPRPQSKRCFDVFPESTRRSIVKVRPGLSGIGSILFSDEERLLAGERSEDFYDTVIAPYKGAVEEWYIVNQSLRIYILIIVATLLVFIIPSKRFVWRVFPDLPKPPVELQFAFN
ncbi:sugar transferase [Oleiphilus messinensis]|uniref:Sugar transferase n=1 Tax=Oleiphilus messinensis TaxID=141451 RepID=A0A1Y0IG80_9GAMM|nr:sugar transferase [Oleiphilus messinensis]ARU59502.1 sugar transferase [Oleiphilus messinensis]